jgi:sugar/nucleoside kinase (ribokinase family)
MARGYMMRPYLCVYGHTNLDYIMTLDRFPELNTSVNVGEKKRYFGGTGANVATIAASLGVPTALASYVGPDFPAEFRSLMEGKGVDLRDLVVVEDQETPTVWVISDAEHNQIAYVYQGPMARMEDMPIRISAAEESVWVHIMTGRPPYYLRVMEECARLGKSVSFDPAQEIHHVWNPEWFDRAISLADIFFCNENELRTAMRYLGMSRAEDLLQKVDLLVNTKGSRGVIICGPEGRMEIPAVTPGKVVDTTGAGDAFRAGFYAGKYRGLKVRDCAVIGAAAASFVIEARGSLTNIPDWGQVMERARNII